MLTDALDPSTAGVRHRLTRARASWAVPNGPDVAALMHDGAMGYTDFVNRLSATRAGGWLTRTTAAKVDPWIYRRSNGRFVMTGKPTIPQVILTTTGRKSDRQREVQLAALRDGDDFVVVASNFGQERHPGWMYNLEAEPRASVRSGGDDIEVNARSLSQEEKEQIWPRLHEIVPQFRTYLDRTDRDIRIFRLRPTRSA